MRGDTDMLSLEMQDTHPRPDNLKQFDPVTLLRCCNNGSVQKEK